MSIEELSRLDLFGWRRLALMNQLPTWEVVSIAIPPTAKDSQVPGSL